MIMREREREQKKGECPINETEGLEKIYILFCFIHLNTRNRHWIIFSNNKRLRSKRRNRAKGKLRAKERIGFG